MAPPTRPKKYTGNVLQQFFQLKLNGWTFIVIFGCKLTLSPRGRGGNGPPLDQNFYLHAQLKLLLLYPEEMIQVMLLKPVCMKPVYDHLDTVTPGYCPLIVQQQQTCPAHQHPGSI